MIPETPELTEFDAISYFDEIPAGMDVHIKTAAWPLLSGHEIDMAIGAGVIDKHTRALWTTEGRRVVISIGAAFIVGLSKNPDPLYAQRTAEIAALRSPQTTGATNNKNSPETS